MANWQFIQLELKRRPNVRPWHDLVYSTPILALAFIAGPTAAR